MGRTLRRRQASEQYRTSSQLAAHLARHVIVRPQAAQVLGGGVMERLWPKGAVKATVEMAEM
jgi:hypothetical protein